ncbi:MULTISPECIES: hypothetical protein [Streptomyces]|uniref:Uncharacterized protein n=2 Tax=Streptomyces TaxID=1883 RepID=A0A2U9P075_STRAS|nr:hypothetical protein [Streptomyces actuosus]AWT42598.1 hypothetical protein DMT42_09910 [Streptomyces actuosus]MBM4819810.1 hypothetical protein [Streptomyces actuosus]
MQSTSQPLDLDATEARASAATPGPWGYYDGSNYADVAADLEITGRGSYSYREKVARLEDENYWDDLAHEDDADERAPEQMAANAEFIAHARTDVPAMAAEIRRLRAQADMVCALCETPVAWIDCPTGGWWAHDEHPADGHDASPKPAAVETHVVADDSDDPEHTDDCPGCTARP